MRRSLIPAIAFLLVMVLGPMASALGNYTLSGGGQAPGQPVLAGLGDLDDALGDLVTFRAVGDVTVTVACTKVVPNKPQMNKTFTRSVTLDVDVPVTARYSRNANDPTLTRFDLDAVGALQLPPDVCPSGWTGSPGEYLSTIALIAYYGEASFLVDSNVRF